MDKKLSPRIVRRNIGFQIKKIREEKQLTQQAIAEDLEISLTAYGEIERGHTNFSIDRLIAIIQLLDIPLTQLTAKPETTSISKESLRSVIGVKQEEIAKLLLVPAIGNKVVLSQLLELYGVVEKLLLLG